MKKKLKTFLIGSLTVLLSACGETTTSCSHVDGDKNHLCDLCSEKLSDCVDANKDHNCDVCGAKLSDCIDNNKDHNCDVCGNKISDCTDNNKDHNCDLCGKKISDCADNDKDHNCDICGKVYTVHIDDDWNDICDICGQPYSPYNTVNAPVPEKVDERMGYEIGTFSGEKPTSGTATVDLYSINDLHGAITENIGLANLGTYMKSKTSQKNTLFFDLGDTYQGSLDSNYNKGRLINDVFAAAHLSSRTIGNHDFDWGTNPLYLNTKRPYNGYTIPVLGANIYDFDFETKTVGSTQLYNLGREYATYVLDNGLKVGVVGVIGSNQITSIATSLVKNLTFTDHIAKIKEVSDFLRVEKNCDIVIANEHDAYEPEQEDTLTDVSPVSGKQYVDFVFNGHSHNNEKFTKNGVKFVQCGSSGNAVGHAVLTYDWSKKEVLQEETTYRYDNIKAVKNEASQLGIDKEIAGLIEKYKAQTDELGKKVLTTHLAGTFSRSSNNPSLLNLLNEAIYTECQKQGYNVDFTYVTEARDNITSETLTYSELFDAFPFDNTVYIIKGKGNKWASELSSYNYVYNTGITKVDGNTTYTVAALDYLAFHTNVKREYDYFPNSTEVGSLKNEDGTLITYRDILANYLLANPNKVFDPADYSASEARFTRPAKA